MERNLEHSLIIIDDATGLPVFNPEARNIKEFKDLIAGSRKKGMNGERAKAKATARMAAVFAVTSYKSWYYPKMDFDDRLEAVANGKEIIDFTLDDVDDDFKRACAKLRELESTPTIEALEELMSAMRLSLKFIKSIRREIERTLESDTLSSAEKDMVIHNIEKQVSLATSLPKHIESLEDVMKTVKKEAEIKSYGKSKGSRNPRKG